MAQCNLTVGAIDANVDAILESWHRASAAGADLVVFSELAITGYLPDDLLLSPEFLRAATAAWQRLCAEGPTDTTAVVGGVGVTADDPELERWDVAREAQDLRNRAAVIRGGAIVATYDKWRLPNFGVFDEARYFVSGDDVVVADVAGVAVGITICEDLWTTGGALAAAGAAGAEVIVNLNASPFHAGKRARREHWVRHHAGATGAAVLYVNQVGGQDDVVFDGDSIAIAPDGTVLARGAQHESDLVIFDLDLAAPVPDASAARGAAPDPVGEVYEALVLGTRDYLAKNGFTTAVLGLSGGIDSALVCAIATDALGADNVTAVAMPSPWSSDHSLADAKSLAENLGCRYLTVPIEPAMVAFDAMLADEFAGTESGVAEENLQSRIRGTLLMAMSNKFGHLLLTTGNKSEYAVGYATLYGDMAGGYAPIKDVPKMLVWELCRWRNATTTRPGAVIPRS
ncbi:MAG: NAD+ synthase (glutamine-hydrolyzing), partial [Glaciecola sp.]